MAKVAVTRDLFPKSEVTKAQVEERASSRRADPGVQSVVVEEEDDNWALVTTRQIIGADFDL